MKFVYAMLLVGLGLIVASLLLYTSNSGKTRQSPAVLANEVFAESEISKAIDESWNDAILFLQRPVTSVDPEKIERKKRIYAETLAEMTSMEAVVKKDMMKNITAELQKNFTAEELEQLVNIAKNPVSRKYAGFLKSQQVAEVIDLPNAKVRELLKQISEKSSQ